MNPEGLRARSVVLSGVGALGVCYPLLRWWSGSGRVLPQNSWAGAALLVLVAASLLAAAWQIRSYVQDRPGARRPTPQFGRGVLVASRASAVAGGLATGWYLAQALVRLANAGVSDHQRSAAILAGALTLASILLAVTGLVGQSWCRIPPEDDDTAASAGGDPAPA